jgi:pimeloyl-ACP methyl ester carboxylesterase
VRRDVGKVLRGIDPRLTLDAASRLERYRQPVLLAWAPEDPLFPIAHAERLAKIFPNARVEPIAGSRTLVPLDQPEALAASLLRFVGESRQHLALARR